MKFNVMFTVIYYEKYNLEFNLFQRARAERTLQQENWEEIKAYIRRLNERQNKNVMKIETSLHREIITQENSWFGCRFPAQNIWDTHIFTALPTKYKLSMLWKTKI